MRDYPIYIYYSDEAGGYIADIPDLKDCSAVDSSPEAALQALLSVKALWLEAARAEGRPIPPPRYPPSSYQTVAGNTDAGAQSTAGLSDLLDGGAASGLQPLTGLSKQELQALAEVVAGPHRQEQIAALLAANREGTLAAEETSALDALLAEIDGLALLKARARYTLHLLAANDAGDPLE